MTHGSDIFSSGTSSLFLPDLTLWFQRNTGRDSLPEDWRGLSLEEICRDLDVPCFSFQKPWKTEYRGVKYTGEGGTPEKDASGARILFRRWETSRGTLAASWTLGPDGDWWQTEYPVKSVEDISAALEIARARIYVPEPFTGGPGGALELPMRPYSEVRKSFIAAARGSSYTPAAAWRASCPGSRRRGSTSLKGSRDRPRGIRAWRRHGISRDPERFCGAAWPRITCFPPGRTKSSGPPQRRPSARRKKSPEP